MNKTQLKKPESANDINVGDILHHSWGYDMTINEFCVVLKNTGKTLLCQMIGNKYVEGNAMTGSVKPDKSIKEGKPFRVIMKNKYSKVNDYSSFSMVGSYPFVINQNGTESKRKGYWSKHDGEKSYYENHMD